MSIPERIESPPRRVSITWRDSFDMTNSWNSVEDILDYVKVNPYLIVTIGWIVAQTEHYLIIAHSVKEDMKPPIAAGAIAIPRAAVLDFHAVEGD